MLALDDESGAGRADLAVAGAILAELSFRGAIAIDVEGKKAYVRPVHGQLPGRPDELLAECLDDITGSAKRRQVGRWVQTFSGKKKLTARVAARLVADGVLSERKRKILFIGLTQYPASNPLPEAELTERMRAALEHDHVTPGPRTVALLTIADAANLLTKNLDRKMVRARKNRLKELGESDQIGQAVKAALDAINAAIIVAVTASAAAGS